MCGEGKGQAAPALGEELTEVGLEATRRHVAWAETSLTHSAEVWMGVAVVADILEQVAKVGEPVLEWPGVVVVVAHRMVAAVVDRQGAVVVELAEMKDVGKVGLVDTKIAAVVEVVRKLAVDAGRPAQMV